MKQGGATWEEITQKMMHLFPDKTFSQALETLRRPYRRVTEKRRIAPVKLVDSEAVQKTYGESVEHKADGSVTHDRLIAICEGEEITPEVLMRAHNIDPSYWVVVAYRNNLWHSQTAGDRLIMYQSRVTVRPIKEGEISIPEVVKIFQKLDRTHAPRVCKHEEVNSGRLLEVNIADLHLGKLAWVGETGDSYDYKIARERFFQVVDAEVARAKAGQYEKILFVWCNDFFNSDGIASQTTGGTPQDTDLRWQKLFAVGCDMLVTAVEALAEHAPVETFYIASNHARQAEYYALKYLSAWFRKDERVTINVDASPRKYLRWGIVLLGFTHASYEGKARLKSLMSIEAAQAWALTSWREMHVAHIHSERVEEDAGVIVRHSPTVTSADAWHTSSGYVGAVKRSYSYEWDKQSGLVAMYSVSI